MAIAPAAPPAPPAPPESAGDGSGVCPVRMPGASFGVGNDDAGGGVMIRGIIVAAGTLGRAGAGCAGGSAGGATGGATTRRGCEPVSSALELAAVATASRGCEPVMSEVDGAPAPIEIRASELRSVACTPVVGAPGEIAIEAGAASSNAAANAPADSNRSLGEGASARAIAASNSDGQTIPSSRARAASEATIDALSAASDAASTPWSSDLPEMAK